MGWSRSMLAACLACALAGCHDKTAKGVCPDGRSCEEVRWSHFDKVDVLVVVDNSMSMTTAQDALASRLPGFVETLLAPGIDPSTGVPERPAVRSLHVGVVSTDMGTGGYVVDTCDDPADGDAGILQPITAAGSCPSSGSYLSFDPEVVTPDLLDEMSTSVGCIVRLGIDGCGFEQTLEASLAALTVRAETANAGFVREDSLLVVLYLTDEDDCSASDTRIFDPSRPDFCALCYPCNLKPELLHPVERYREGFEILSAGRPWPVLVGMIVGVPPDLDACNGPGDRLGGCVDEPIMQPSYDEVPACTWDTSAAYPASRMVSLAQGMGPDAVVHSLCNPDMDPLFDRLLERWDVLMDGYCGTAGGHLVKDPGDPCICRSGCDLVYVLADRGPCPDPLEDWDPDGDGSATVIVEETGEEATACRVPGGDSRLSECDLECDDPSQRLLPAGQGWWFGLDGEGAPCLTVMLGNIELQPPEGSTAILACR